MIIPKNWELKKMTQVVLWSSGGTPRATEKLYYENGTIPWLVIGDLNDGAVNCAASHITELGLKNSSAKMMPAGTLLVAMYGSIGKLGITGMPCCTNQAIAFAKELYGVTTKYMFYYLSMIKPQLITKGKGGTQKNISLTVLNSIDVVVPPIEEQARIVARIEELFSELDAGVDTLQKIKQQLSVYRQAVLKEAFAGELTETWRQIHPEETTDSIVNLIEARGQKIDLELLESIPIPAIPNAWKWVNLGSVSSGPEYGTSQKSSDTGKIPVIRMGNLQKGRIDWRDLAYTSNDEDIEKYRLSKGDVLFNRTNSPDLVGKTAIYRGEREAIFAGYLIRINQLDCIDPDYLTYYMNSNVARSYGNSVKTDGVNQSNINGKKLCSYPFPLCSEAEQKQVVYELESRLSLCDSIEKTVDEALQQSAAMRQSILKQAFEGGLSYE